jgi:hypothetical protein
MKSILYLVLPLAWLVAAASAGPASLPRKLIMTGWDSPDTAQFRRDAGSMEQWPFDGAVIYAQGQGGDGRWFDAKAAFSASHWEPTCLSNALTDLKSAHPGKLTDNFLIFGANPGNVDWFDDAGCKEIQEHCRLLARLAHEGGLKGLLFDPEAYTEPFKQFWYGNQPRRAEHSFEDYCHKARQRGREVMAAVTSEFPDAALYTYFLFSQCSRALSGDGEPQSCLSSDGYGLLPSFADGLLDRMPPAVTLIDGNEEAYRYNSEAAFNAAFVRIKNECQALVSPENRPKFRAQLQVSHGIYLDAHVNPPSSPWYIDGLGGPRVDRLEQNVASALRAADQYVWVYGERARWWPPRQPDAKAPKTWPEVLPGIEFALLNAKDPAEAARRKLKELRSQGGLTNLLVNGDFAAGKDGQPESWSRWQDEKESHGSFSHDPAVGVAGPGSACLSAIEHGCFVQGVKADPGRRYLLCAKVRQSGAGAAWLTARWQTAEGKWTAEDRDMRFSAPARDDLASWREVVGIVVVPEGAGQLVVLAGASGQQNPNDRVWFDDVLVAPVVQTPLPTGHAGSE